MRIEISKPTIKHLTSKYPQLTDNIIQYLFFRGRLDRRYMKSYGGRMFEALYSPYHVLIIPKEVAQAYHIDYELDIIPDEDGIIYRIHIDD